MKYNNVFFLVTIFVYSLITTVATPALVSALPEEDARSLIYDSVYYSEDDSSSTSSGSGTGCFTITDISINDPDGLASVLEEYIQNHQPSSPFTNLGDAFVSGGKQDGINPLLLVGLIKKESSFGTNWGANSPETHNAFNRRAKDSQPSIDGWYRYDSWTQSLNGGEGFDDIPNYINRVYVEEDIESLEEFMHKYAPPSENNTDLYIEQLRQSMREMIELSGDSISCGSGSGEWVWPLEGGGTITSCFGPRSKPTSGASSNHSGVDIADGNGTPVLAADSGEVVFAGRSRKGSGGLILNIQHGDGHGDGVATQYLHNSRLLKNVGEKVSAGEHIADEGATGDVTGSHLHFEIIRNGEKINALDELEIPDGVSITGSNCDSSNTGGHL